MKVTRRILRWLLFASYLSFSVSLLLFSLLEIVPSLLDHINVQTMVYYALKKEYLPDPVLVFINRNRRHRSLNFYGDLYSGDEGVPVWPIRSEASYNKWGFRVNSSAPPFTAVVIGDSFVEYSENDLDTFSERLKAVSGLSTFNLGRAWYGPYQYLELFRRYAVPLRERYAILCFFAGNDITDIQEYRQWLTTGEYYFYTDYSRASFLRRYHMAGYEAPMALLNVIESWWAEPKLKPRPAANLGVFQLGKQRVVMKTDYWNQTETTQRLLSSEPWEDLRSLLTEFHHLSIENGITPIVVYIPTKIQVYGRFFTGEGGPEVLAKIKGQLLFETNSAQAFRILAQQLDIGLIDLLPGFQRLAAEGKLLYYPFDTHWNREGREAAAKLVGAALGASTSPEKTAN